MPANDDEPPGRKPGGRLWRIIGFLILAISFASSASAEQAGSALPGGGAGIFGTGGGASGNVEAATGTATATFTFALPPGRGGVGPQLALHYSHTHGPDIAGEGWSLALPTITRRGVASAPPSFDGTDHYELSGEPLVRVCVAPCTNELTPSWASGWTVYRAVAELVPQLVFSTHDARTWRVLRSDGGFLEFGVPFGSTDERGLDVDRVSGAAVLWNLVREQDAQPAGRNVVVYRWKHLLEGSALDRGVLTDVYWTAPVDGSLEEISLYAHHVHLAYEAWRPLPARVYPPMVMRHHDRRLVSVNLASKGQDTALPRERVRVYRLEYRDWPELPIAGRPYLTRITPFGRCAAPHIEQEIGTDRDRWQLPEGDTTCASMPPTTFEYSPFRATDDPAISRILIANAGNPPLSPPNLALDRIAVADVNRDALPDLIQSHPSRIFLNPGRSAAYSARSFKYAPLIADPPSLLLNSDAETLFSNRKGLTLLGYWTDRWPLSLLVRRGPPVSPSDGSPKELLRVDYNGWGRLRADTPGTWGWSTPAVLPPPHLVGDLDNDALADAVYDTRVALSRRQPNGTIAHFAVLKNSNLSVPDPTKYATLADMDGDGLLDYVTTHDPKAHWGEFVYIPGRGDGTFGCEQVIGNGCEPAVSSAGHNPTTGQSLWEVRLRAFGGGPPHLPELSDPDAASEQIFFHDVTGDGRAELIHFQGYATEAQVDTWINLDGINFRREIRHLPKTEYPAVRRAFFADMNGNGSDDLVLLGHDGGLILDYTAAIAAFHRAGLLVKINHAGGATTKFEYRHVTDIETESDFVGIWPTDPHDHATGPWLYHSPTPLIVVSYVEINSNAPDPAGVADPFRTVTHFYYREPVFDTWRDRFRGFRRTRVSVSGSEEVDTLYYFGHCLAPDNWEPSFTKTPLSRQCTNPESDRFEVLQGLPIQIEHLDRASKVYASTTRFTYRLEDRSTVNGQQFFAWVQSKDTFLYDTSPFVASSKVIQSDIVYYPDDTAIPTGVTEIPALKPLIGTVILRADAVRLRERQAYTKYRTVGAASDDGRVALEPAATPAAIDRPIVRQIEWKPIPGPGVWRATKQTTGYEGEGQVAPLVSDSPVRELQFEHDAWARLIKVRAPLSGALPLERFHQSGQMIAQSGQMIASEPPSAAVNGETYTLLSLTYDDLGNVVEREGADQQCERGSFLPPYRDLLQSRTTYVSGCASPNGLVTSLTFDRGLGALTSLTTPSMSQSVISYDLIGRVLSISSPDPVTSGTSNPEIRVEYAPTLEGPVHWAKVTRYSPDAGDRVSWHFTNSVGQPIAMLEQADPAAGDAAAWIVHPAPEIDDLGRPIAWFRPWFYANPLDQLAAFPHWGPPVMTARYKFGRLTSLFEGSFPLMRRDHHALSVDVWDAENLKNGGPHQGAYTHIALDGHGRVIQSRTIGAGQPTTFFDYLPTGELVALEQRFVDASGTERRYKRWRRFDSIGRVVENAEPNTSSAFAEDPAVPGGMRAWRYSYDKSGRLVGTRDARGCGKNLFYDGADRLLAEDYSPCELAHEPYTSPNLFDGTGTEAFYAYDHSGLSGLQPYPAASNGRLVGAWDRGSETRFAYDGRGRAIGATRRITKPAPPCPPAGSCPYASLPSLANRYANHAYALRTVFDGLDRVKVQSTGADAPELLENGLSELYFHYSARGLVVRIESSYGALVTHQRADADGFVTQVRFGDAAGTTYEMTPDARRRLSTFRLFRPQGPWASGGGYLPPVDGSTLQSELVNQKITYDLVDNITKIEDLRDPQFWPAGAKPTGQKLISHDSQYRVVATDAFHGQDIFVSPVASEMASGDVRPVPQLKLANRAISTRHSYDGLGNLLGRSELPGVFYDRGLDNVSIGYAIGKPNQLISADGGAAGKLAAYYDTAGNLIALDVERPPSQCLASSQKCSHRFRYDWDEVNQLVRARRWDYTSLEGEPSHPALPTGAPQAELGFTYSDGVRLGKRVIAGEAPRYVIDVFASLRLDDAAFDAAANDYVGSQRVHLPGLGKVFHEAGLPSTGSDRHVFLAFADHLGSTSVVVDKATGELVEHRGYQPYGATDYDLRTGRWRNFRDETHFTGKEEDVETGLVYFGARYYSPHLQRFISADPLAVHAWTADINPYAYVNGRVYVETDPLGLDSGCLGAEKCPGAELGGDSGGGIIIQFPIDIGGGSASGAAPGPGFVAPSSPPPPIAWTRSFASGLANTFVSQAVSNWQKTTVGGIVTAVADVLNPKATAIGFARGSLRSFLESQADLLTGGTGVLNWSYTAFAPRAFTPAAWIPPNTNDPGERAGEAVQKIQHEMRVAILGAVGAGAIKNAVVGSAGRAGEIMSDMWAARGHPFWFFKVSVSVAEGVNEAGQTVKLVGTNSSTILGMIGDFLRPGEQPVPVHFSRSLGRIAHSEHAIINYAVQHRIILRNIVSWPRGCGNCLWLLERTFPGVMHSNPSLLGPIRPVPGR